MKLKQLTLQGYKTFASKTDFVFDEGITAIVGPNGSGKSNVADALRWVLGEQNYAALRGKRTSDMIFTGSQTRPRAGMAQATLTLDNSDNWLPIDYSEIEIARRAYRSGENDYYLNGQKVRLRDVQELLATSGLAERTYTIIGQGLIDQALSLRAEERRALFEEAAGISHYKNRRAETLRRLQETQHNLERVQDILAEIEPRLVSLKRQAARAKNYEQVAADLRQLLRIWYGYQWQQAKQGVRHYRQESQESERDWRESRQQWLAYQSQIDELRRQIGQWQWQINDRQGSLERLREQREQSRRQLAILGERLAALTRQQQEIGQEIPRLQQQGAAAQESLGLAVAELDKANGQLALLRDQFALFQQNFEGQQAEIGQTRKLAHQLEQEYRQGQHKLAQMEGQLSQLRERLQEQQNPGRDTSLALAQADEQIGRLNLVVESAQASLNELRHKRNESRDKQQTLNKPMKEARQANGETTRQINLAQKELARLEARWEMLEQQRPKELSLKNLRPVGQLASLIPIPNPYQKALEAALGPRLATLLLSDEASLWQLLGHNDKRQLLTALVMPECDPAGYDPLEHPEVIGWASALLDVPAGLERVVALLFGPVLLVRQAQAAYQLAKGLPAGTMAVTLDGFVVHAGGLVERLPADNQQGLLARESAWRAAKEALEGQRDVLATSQAQADHQQQEIRRLQDELEQLAQEERRLNRLEGEAAQRLDRAQREAERAKQQRDFLHKQISSGREEAERLKQRVSGLEHNLSQQQQTLSQIEIKLNDSRAHLASLPVVEGQQQQRNWQQQLETSQMIVTGREAVVESRRATLHQLESQLARQQERLQDNHRQQNQLQLGKEEAALEHLEQQIAQVESTIRPLRERASEKQKSLSQLEEGLGKIQQRTHDLETRYTQLKVALGQRESHIEGLQERIKADLGPVALSFDEDQLGQNPLPMSEVVDRLPEIEQLPDDIEETIQRCRGQLQRIGAINPEAPAEYQQTQERFDFLSQQVADLLKTEGQLRRVVAELDDLTSKAFAATVEMVDGVFGPMFQRLFGGGAARLVLTEPDDLTISGVDMIARLPGRREQGLALLSGGERSLTAAALIFALLKVSPPPFCVMDEVDAMLDEANVTRFREAIQELSQTMQFIVITHNRGTVQAAQTIYGISMGPDSASQAISLRPESYLSHGE